MKGTTLKIFTDGGARGNPGPAAAGFLIKDEKGKTLIEKGEYLGEATNNVAEYQGAIKALEWLVANQEVIAGRERIDFFLDSQLVVNQLNGIFKVKNAGLRSLMVEVRQLEGEITPPRSITGIFPGRKTKKQTLWLIKFWIVAKKIDKERFLNGDPSLSFLALRYKIGAWFLLPSLRSQKKCRGSWLPAEHPS